MSRGAPQHLRQMTSDYLTRMYCTKNLTESSRGVVLAFGDLDPVHVCAPRMCHTNEHRLHTSHGQYERAQTGQGTTPVHFCRRALLANRRAAGVVLARSPSGHTDCSTCMTACIITPTGPMCTPSIHTRKRTRSQQQIIQQQQNHRHVPAVRGNFMGVKASSTARRFKCRGARLTDSRVLKSAKSCVCACVCACVLFARLDILS